MRAKLLAFWRSLPSWQRWDMRQLLLLILIYASLNPLNKQQIMATLFVVILIKSFMLIYNTFTGKED